MKNGTADMRSVAQLSVFLVNKPGVLARVCATLAAAKINIIAMCIMESTEHGVMRMVVESPDAARAALAALDLVTTEAHVLMATMPNRPGSLADVVERLAEAHINVNYAYCTTGAPGGKTLGIFRVSDIQKAIKVLSEHKAKRRESVGAVRATKARAARR